MVVLNYCLPQQDMRDALPQVPLLMLSFGFSCCCNCTCINASCVTIET